MALDFFWNNNLTIYLIYNLGFFCDKYFIWKQKKTMNYLIVKVCV